MVRSLLSRYKFSVKQWVMFGAAAAVVGSMAMFASYASPPTASSEAELGSVSGGAQVTTIAGASGGSAIRFGSTPDCPPVPSVPDTACAGLPTGVTPSPIATVYPDAAAQGYSVNANGRVIITKDGGVYDGVLFSDGFEVRANNITIRNSRITSDRSSFAGANGILSEPQSWQECRDIYTAYGNGRTYSTVLATNSNVSNLLIENSDIITGDSTYLSGFMGYNTTIRRVEFSGGVDAVGVHSPTGTTANVTVEDSWIHNLYYGTWSPGNYNTDPATSTRVYCGYDAAHPEGTHNDGLQLHDSTNVTIQRNTINVKPTNHSQSNAGIMLNGDGDVHIIGNKFQYGACSINIVSGLTLPIEVRDNIFYGNNNADAAGGQNDGGCAIITPLSAGYTFSNNAWSTGAAIRLTRGG